MKSAFVFSRMLRDEMMNNEKSPAGKLSMRCQGNPFSGIWALAAFLCVADTPRVTSENNLVILRGRGHFRGVGYRLQMVVESHHREEALENREKALSKLEEREARTADSIKQREGQNVAGSCLTATQMNWNCRNISDLNYQAGGGNWLQG